MSGSGTNESRPVSVVVIGQRLGRGSRALLCAVRSLGLLFERGEKKEGRPRSPESADGEETDEEGKRAEADEPGR